MHLKSSKVRIKFHQLEYDVVRRRFASGNYIALIKKKIQDHACGCYTGSSINLNLPIG